MTAMAGQAALVAPAAMAPGPNMMSAAAAAGSRGAWTPAAGPGPYMTQGPQGPPMTQPPMAQRPYSSGNYSMSAQAMRGPWENSSPPRGQWAMNRDYVVSQPKVVNDRVV